MHKIKVAGEGEVKWDRIKRDLTNAKTNLTKKITKETKLFEDVSTFVTPGAPKSSELIHLKTELTHLNEVMPSYLVSIKKAIMEAEKFVREETFPSGKENLKTEALEERNKTADEYTTKYNSCLADLNDKYYEAGAGAGGNTNAVSTSPGQCFQQLSDLMPGILTREPLHYRSRI